MSSFCPFLFFFFFFFPSFKILFTFLKKKIIYFLWLLLIAKKQRRKDMEINTLALGFMLVLQDSDCYNNICLNKSDLTLVIDQK